MKYKTEQEAFWAGQFGDEYVNRNNSEQVIASNTALFAKALSRAQKISSIIEFGSNIGMNLTALRRLLPEVELSAVEINKRAVDCLKEKKEITHVYHQSLLEFCPDYQRDLVLIKGVLIHINPEELDTVYSLLYNASSKYILLSEYYNPVPVEVNYRGHEGKLFKRDFAGEMLEQYPDLKLADYGFVYRRDNNFPKDDGTWFLLEKVLS